MGLHFFFFSCMGYTPITFIGEQFFFPFSFPADGLVFSLFLPINGDGVVIGISKVFLSFTRTRIATT